MNIIDLITRSLRRVGVVAAGELPQDAERDDAFETVKALYRRLINEGCFGELTDIFPTTEAIMAQAGQRIVASLGQVSLPDIATDLSVICVVDPTTNEEDELLFDARIQKWVSIDDLTLTSEAPLSKRDGLGLICALAVELADDYGQTASEMTVRNAARWQSALAHNWSAQPTFNPRSVWF